MDYYLSGTPRVQTWKVETENVSSLLKGKINWKLFDR